MKFRFFGGKKSAQELMDSYFREHGIKSGSSTYDTSYNCLKLATKRGIEDSYAAAGIALVWGDRTSRLYFIGSLGSFAPRYETAEAQVFASNRETINNVSEYLAKKGKKSADDLRRELSELYGEWRHLEKEAMEHGETIKTD